MVTYEFYRDMYLGSRLEEDTFPKAIARAERWIQKLERNFRVEPVGEDSRDLAICAVAEAMDEHAASRGVAQTTVGKVSVRYKERKALEQRLYRCVQVFLDIRRGVTA